jgi:hypothetical protein
MDDFLHLQLLQQQKMLPPIGRRASLLACMDEDGNIDAVRYIQLSRMKRASFFYHMNNLFPNSGASSLIPPSTTSMSSGMTNSLPTTASNIAALGAFGNNTGFIGNSNFYGCTPPQASRVDFSRTGFAPSSRLTSTMYGREGPTYQRSPMIPALSSFSTSSSLQTNSFWRGDVNGTTAQSLSLLPPAAAAGMQQQLRKDEYEAAEALLFSMGRICPSNKSQRDASSTIIEKRSDDEEEEGSTVSKNIAADASPAKKKNPPKKNRGKYQPRQAKKQRKVSRVSSPKRKKSEATIIKNRDSMAEDVDSGVDHVTAGPLKRLIKKE